MKDKVNQLLSGSKVHNSVFDRKFMYLSDIIDPIYHEYLIRLEHSGHELDLDVLRPHHQVENYREIAALLVAYFEFILKQKEKKGNLLISMTEERSSITDITPVRYAITIRDDSTILTLEQRERLGTLGARAKSRLGFGSTVSLEIKEPYEKL